MTKNCPCVVLFLFILFEIHWTFWICKCMSSSRFWKCLAIVISNTFSLNYFLFYTLRVQLYACYTFGYCYTDNWNSVYDFQSVFSFFFSDIFCLLISQFIDSYVSLSIDVKLVHLIFKIYIFIVLLVFSIVFFSYF